MTKENWLNLAMVVAVVLTAVATLVGPPLAVLVQFRLSQQHKPRKETAPKGRFRKFICYFDFRKNWFFFVGMLISFGIASFGHARAAHHFDRQSVSWMIFGICGYFYFAAFFVVNKYFDRFGRYIWEDLNNLLQFDEDSEHKPENDNGSDH